MKKALAILLLVVFLFNVGGYYLAYWALEYKLNRDLTIRIDSNDYSASETFELKIPLSLPYPIQEAGYERVDGKFQYNGEYYTLVKRKLEKDTLYIVCIRNHDKKTLVDTITEYVKVTNDLPGTAKKAVSFFGKLLKEFDSGPAISVVHVEGWSRPLSFSDAAAYLPPATADVPSPPPNS